MTTYKYTISGVVKDGNTFIAVDETNIDYQQYLQWVANGGITEPADVIIETTPVPIVSAWQIRKALNAAGLRQSVEDAVAAADITVQDAWQYAKEFERNHPLVVSLGAALGKSEDELDQLFDLAIGL